MEKFADGLVFAGRVNENIPVGLGNGLDDVLVENIDNMDWE